MWIHGIIALITALVVSTVLVTTLRRRGPGPWSGFLFFFILLFGFVWAVGAWAHPVGAGMPRVSWPSFVLAGILILLVIAAVTAPHPPEESARSEDWKAGEETERKVVEATASIFFWLALVGLLAVIVSTYL